MAERVPILPETKIGRLLKDWPELEEVLVALSPAFRKLANPVLRRTVARVATLRAAAKMGGLEVSALVGALREAAGLDPMDLPDEDAPEPEPPAGPEGTVVETIDADALLESGANPLVEVKKRAKLLGVGEILRIRSSFLPEPLLQEMAKDGLSTRVVEGSDSMYETLVGRG